MRPIIVLVAAVQLALVAPVAGRAEAGKLGVSVTFADARALEKYRAYVSFLSSDPVHFDAELATLARLEASDVEYVIRVGGLCHDGVEGSLSTDGRRVYITLSDNGGAFGETASVNSRLAHELEHARQFDAGEIAFAKDARSGAWKPVLSSYDIGDEVKAWDAQLRASCPKDFWLVTVRTRTPSLLGLFAAAAGDEARQNILRRHGYADRYPVPDSDVVFPAASGVAAGSMIRPTDALAFFGRVRRVA